MNIEEVVKQTISDLFKLKFLTASDSTTQHSSSNIEFQNSADWSDWNRLKAINGENVHTLTLYMYTTYLYTKSKVKRRPSTKNEATDM